MFRAPEVMLQLDYGPGIDLWSVAAILIEARGGKTAFPGLDCLDMLQRFTEVIGPTPDHMIQQCSQANPELADFYFDGSMLRGMASHPPAKYAMSSTQPSDLPLSLLQGSFEGQETTPDALTAYELAASRQTNSFHSNSNMTSCTQTPPTANVSRAVSQSMGKTMSRTPSCKIFDENQQSHKFARITNNRKISDLFNGKAKDGAFTSFLEMLLRWDPEMRPAPLSALDHPWIKNGNALRHSYSREPSAKLESLFSSSFKI
jgi:serine/threonine protein kinase